MDLPQDTRQKHLAPGKACWLPSIASLRLPGRSIQDVALPQIECCLPEQTHEKRKRYRTRSSADTMNFAAPVVGFCFIFVAIAFLIHYNQKHRKQQRSQSKCISTTPVRLRRPQATQSSLLPTYHVYHHSSSPPNAGIRAPNKSLHQNSNEPLPRLFSHHSSYAAATRQADQDRRRQSGQSTSWTGQSRFSARLDAPLPSPPQPVASPTTAPARSPSRRTATEDDPPPPYVA